MMQSNVVRARAGAATIALVQLSGEAAAAVARSGVMAMYGVINDWPDADRSSRLVFVTRDLPRAAIEDGLRRCVGSAYTVQEQATRAQLTAGRASKVTALSFTMEIQS